MKVRLTILTENNCQREPKITEEKIQRAWQAIFDIISLDAENDDRAIVEKVEFVEGDNVCVKR